MGIAPLALLLLALPQDPAELTEKGIQALRQAEQAAASGQLQGLEVVDAFMAAAATLRRACEQDGAPAEAYEGWSEALLNCSDYTNSIRAIDSGLRAHPDDLRLLLQEGRVQGARAGEYAGDEKKQREQWTKAAKAYRRAMDRHPKAADAAVRFGEMQIYLGEREKGIAAWREALKRDPAAVDLGNLSAWLGEDAIPLLSELVESDPANTLARWYRGYAEYSAFTQQMQVEGGAGGALALWDACREDFLAVLEENPQQYANSWYFLAYGAMSAAGLREGTGVEDEYFLSARAWGHYLEGFGANQTAALNAGSDTDREGFYAQVKWLMGKAYERRDAQTSVRLATWLAANTPDDVEAWNNLAFFHREVGSAEQSLQAYEAALRLTPEDPQVMNDLAVILHYYLRKDDERALSLYAKAIELGEQQLADTSGMPESEIERLRIGLRDARNNHRKLSAGNRSNF